MNIDVDERECDSCGCITDAGAWPDWVNGSCESCDPEILDHEDNTHTHETKETK